MKLTRGKRKVLKGRVKSDRMQKTIIVEVERKFRHPLYKKVIKKKENYKVHNPDDVAHIGDFVEIMETRPLSKDKRWRLVRVLEKAKGIEEKTRDLAPSMDPMKGNISNE